MPRLSPDSIAARLHQSRYEKQNTQNREKYALIFLINVKATEFFFTM